MTACGQKRFGKYPVYIPQPSGQSQSTQQRGFYSISDRKSVRTAAGIPDEPTADVISVVLPANFGELIAQAAKHGEKPLFRFDVITKAKSPTVNNYYTLRTDDELERFILLANGIEKSVNSGNFYPNESGFGCGECAYRDRCKKWR